MNKVKKVIVIAGPNGAGKSTFAQAFLPAEAQCPTFINADLIAAGLSPFAPELAAIKAGRIMLNEMEDCVRRGVNFAIETTLSGRSYVQRFKQWQASGYRVILFFLALPNADTAVARVAQRVLQGGHHVPEAVVRRRFAAGLSNFENMYRDIADEWALYDNSGPFPELIRWGEKQ